MSRNGALVGQTILFLAYSPWDVFRQDNELASLLWRENRVLYVEKQRRWGQGRSRHTSARQQLRSGGLVRESSSLAVCTPPARLPWCVGVRPDVLKRLAFRLSLRLNAARLVSVVRRALADLDWRPSVLWCYEPDALLMRRFFDVRWAGYRVYDEITLFPFWEPIRSEYVLFEQTVIGQADYVFASSPAQFEKRRRWHHQAHLLPNAGAYDRYSRYNAPGQAPDRPVDLPSQGPVMMYIGTLDYRLDYDLCVRLAAETPQWQWVFVGRVKLTSAGDGPSRLRRLPNVHLLGEKPPQVLPDYLFYADVSLIPYCITESTRTMFPWKVYEHLAMGKPIVTTALPALAELENCLHWATSHETFLEGIRSALSEGRDGPRAKERIRLAERNSWQVRVREIADIVGEAR